MTTRDNADSTRQTRLGGGIYLLAKSTARGWIKGTDCGTWHITVLTSRGPSVSAVYLPLSMTTSGISDVFQRISSSTIILGDINVRFRDPDTQEGSAGPPDRLDALQRCLAASAYVRLLPGDVPAFAYEHWGRRLEWRLRNQFTLDHAFVKAMHQTVVRLFLVDRGHLKIETDH